MAKFANTVSERTVGSQEEVAKWIWCDCETGPSEMEIFWQLEFPATHCRKHIYKEIKSCCT